MCKLRLNGTDRIHRAGKWGVDESTYRNVRFWPFSFCLGYVVIYSSEFVSEIYMAATSNCTPFVWLDDVTGTLAKNLGNITHSGLKGIRNHIIYIHNSITKNMYKNWNRVQSFALRRKTT